MLALLIPLLGPVLERLGSLIPDPQARAKAIAEAQTEILTTLSASDVAQVEVNKVEAASVHPWVSGWRPAAGWVCVLGMFYEFIVRPLLPWVVDVCGVDVPPLPSLGDSLMFLMTGMLGLGAYRSFDKAKGTS